jgi:RNA polymerase sigma-70 factor, ECF subfamily
MMHAQLADRAVPASHVSDVDRAITTLWPTAYRIAWLILRDRMVAEDVAQESCVQALQRRSQLRDPDALIPWFRALVSNLALSARRKLDRRHRAELPESHYLETAGNKDSRDLDLARAIDKLNDDLRIPLVLFYYGGFSSLEIGRRLHIPAPTVRYKIAGARERLRLILEVTDDA